MCIRSCRVFFGRFRERCCRFATPALCCRCTGKNENIRIALDLTQEWDKLQESADQGAMITGVIVGRKEFIEENPEAVKKFMDAYKESVEYVSQHVEEASVLIEEYNIVSAAVAEKALPYCNIVFIEGEEMKNKLSGYLNVLAEQNPKSIGGKNSGR